MNYCISCEEVLEDDGDFAFTAMCDECCAENEDNEPEQEPDMGDIEPPSY
jgi:hypothetical protein